MKKWGLLAFLLMIPSLGWSPVASRLNIEETDGSPSTFPYKLKVTNGSLTDNGDGTASLSASGGGSLTSGSTFYIQNTLNPTISTQAFNVQDGAFTDNIYGSSASGLIINTTNYPTGLLSIYGTTGDFGFQTSRAVIGSNGISFYEDNITPANFRICYGACTSRTEFASIVGPGTTSDFYMAGRKMYFGTLTSNNFVNFTSSANFLSDQGIDVAYRVDAGSITGAGLSTCGDATHALAYNSTTGLFSCQLVSGTGGSGASALAIATGTIAGFTVPGTSPTAVINLDSTRFSSTLAGSATAFITLLSSQSFSSMTITTVARVEGNSTFTSSITVSTSMIVSGNTIFTSSVSISTNAVVSGYALFLSSVNISTAVSVSGNSVFKSSMTISSSAVVLGPVTMSTNVYITRDTTFYGNGDLNTNGAWMFRPVLSTGPYTQYVNQASTSVLIINSVQYSPNLTQTRCIEDITFPNGYLMQQVQVTGERDWYVGQTQTVPVLQIYGYQPTSTPLFEIITSSGQHRYYGQGSTDTVQFWNTSGQLGSYLDSGGGWHFNGTAAFPTVGNFYNASVNNGNFYRGDPAGSAQAQGYNLFATTQTWTAGNTFTSSITVTGAGGITNTYGLTSGTGTFYTTSSTPTALVVKSTTNLNIFQIDNRIPSAGDYMLTISTIPGGTGATVFGVNTYGRIISSGSTPTVGVCGTTPAMNASSTDSFGAITWSGAATSCAVNFSANWAAAPFCIGASTGSYVGTYAATTSSITFNFPSLTASTITYHCFGGKGG